MTTSAQNKALVEAAAAFGWDDFRPGQREAMEAAVDGHDVLAVMASGHGKSAIYEAPALVLDGTALVVSPLIALQRDQVERINASIGERTAVMVNSSLKASEVDDAWQAAGSTAKFLFLAPEQFANEEVLERLSAVNISLLVIDEAHCVSAWGHDFRPDYLRLGEVADGLGSPPLVALTATASTLVQREIVDELHMRKPKLLVRGFDRPELHLAVVRHEDDAQKRRAVLEQVADFAGEASDYAGPGLLYTATRKDTEAYRDELMSWGVRAEAYHSGRKKADRDRIHQEFLDGELQVVVATTAFGMGIDKADVRFVVHADIPDSLDSYYQEIGRAGRDGEDARAVLHYRPEDLGLRRFFNTKHADEDALRRVIDTLAGATKPLKSAALREATGLSARKLTGLLNLLEVAGAAAEHDGGYRARRGVKPADAVAKAVEAAEAYERISSSRIEMARQYAETDGCRRQFLLGYFGEQLDEPCGNCDTCEAGTAENAQESRRGVEHFPVQSAVTHREWGSGIVMRHEEDKITVLFEQVGYKSLALQLVEDEKILKPEPEPS